MQDSINSSKTSNLRKPWISWNIRVQCKLLPPVICWWNDELDMQCQYICKPVTWVNTIVDVTASQDLSNTIYKHKINMIKNVSKICTNTKWSWLVYTDEWSHKGIIDVSWIMDYTLNVRNFGKENRLFRCQFWGKC